MSQYDWIIQGGRVIDPANGIDAELDLTISDGEIARVVRGLDPAAADRVYAAAGELVVPGLIDLHAHCHDRATAVGVDIDHYGLGRGVTTAVESNRDVLVGVKVLLPPRGSGPTSSVPMCIP